MVESIYFIIGLQMLAMIKNAVLAICLLLGFTVYGCQEGVRIQHGNPDKLPPFLVGVWKADQYNWAFRFEPDGSIRRLKHILARYTKVEEGSVYMEGKDPNTYAIFILGPIETQYDPNTRELNVKVVVDYYQMKLPFGELEGRSEDYFSGPVSENGKVWRASWTSYSWLEGAIPPDPNLVESNPVELIFTKMKLKKP